VTEPKDDDLNLDLDLDLVEATPSATPLATPAAGMPAATTASPTPTSSFASAPLPSATATPTASVVAEPQPAATGGELEGQWVWQFAAPPPPPPFSAIFFAGRAFPELYRFFAAGVLVALGTLLPWGPTVEWVVNQGNSTVGYSGPPTGFDLPIGAVCLALALWLTWAACYGIYTGRQKILPVFLMLLPAWITWKRTLDAWGQIPDDYGFQLSLYTVFDVAGSGVLLALFGSTLVAVSLLLTIARLTKKDPKAAEKSRAKPRKGDEPAASPTPGAPAAAGADDAGGRRGKKR
jgi:hypothetical protein